MNTDRPIQAEPTGLPQSVKPVSPLTTRRSLASFTLIELLVVITVILILAGISLKVMSVVGSKAGTAKTLMVLEQVKNALGGYYSVFGSYPPVNQVESAAPNNQSASLTNNINCEKGLTSYLLSGKDGSALTRAFCNPEATKWEHYLEGIYSTTSPTNPPTLVGMSMMDSTNLTYTINDGWGHTIHYSVAPDFQSYTLWSEGPTASTNDDIYVTFQ
jgi:prepilin-type N-terminal cleavage/methylation domain-containing protein